MVSLPPSAVAPSLKSLKDPFHRRIQAQPSPCSQPDNYNSQQYEKKALYQVFYEALAHDPRSVPTPARPISDAQYYTLHFCQRLESPASKTATVFGMMAKTDSRHRANPQDRRTPAEIGSTRRASLLASRDPAKNAEFLKCQPAKG